MPGTHRADSLLYRVGLYAHEIAKDIYPKRDNLQDPIVISPVNYRGNDSYAILLSETGAREFEPFEGERPF